MKSLGGQLTPYDDPGMWRILASRWSSLHEKVLVCQLDRGS